MNTSNIKKNRLVIIFLLLSLFLAGCTGVETPTPTASPTVTLIPTATTLPPTATPTAVPTATAETTATVGAAAQSVSSGDRAAFVSETYPDNSVLDAGEAFTKAFELRNAGNVTWTTDYTLVRDETDPAGETLGAAERLALPKAVAPGDTLTLQIPLTAPEDPGTYTVYWTLQNENGTVVPVDGGLRVWATILVCQDGEDCRAPLAAAAGGGASASEVSATLTNFTSNGQSSTGSFCITVPDRNYMLAGGAVSLIVNQQAIMAPGGESLSLSSDMGCYEFTFPVTSAQIQQAETVIISITKITKSVSGDEACLAIRPSLITQYPGLDFQCNYSSGTYYTGLQLPAGMSSDEAQQIIEDAIEGAIYGPWDLTIK